MIINVKCFSCGNVLADKWMYYKRQVRKIKIEQNGEDSVENIVYLSHKNMDTKTAEGQVLDELHITNACCRRTMLTTVELD